MQQKFHILPERISKKYEDDSKWKTSETQKSWLYKKKEGLKKLRGIPIPENERY